MNIPDPQDDSSPAPTPRGLSRRGFVGGALAVPAAAWLTGCGGDSERQIDGRASGQSERRTDMRRSDLADWKAVRALFALDPELHHLSAYILAPHSRPVRAAIARHQRGLDRNPRGYLLAHERLEQMAARAAARHLRTALDRVALTDSTTMGLGVFLGGMRLTPGDEILTTAHEHFAARGAIDLAAERSGARVREIELYPPTAPQRASVKDIVAAVDAGVGPSTRVLVVTWVHSASGVRLPLRAIADLVERKNRGRVEDDRVLVVVDAAHALGAGPIDIDELGCDALIAGCHKWLGGPHGTGMVWARPEAWARVAPTIPSWSGWGRDDRSPGSQMTPGGYHSFEHRWALNEAFALHEAIGAARIAARIDDLGDRLRDGLAAIGGVTLHVPRERELRSGVVCFSVDGLEPGEVVGRLIDEHRVIASTTPYDVELARLGTCWMNTEEEVDAAIAAMTKVAKA